MSVNRYILRSTFVGALGGLLFGFDTAAISGATAGLTRSFGLVNLHPLVPIIHRSMTVSEGSGTHWIMNAILSFAFPVIALRSGAYPFVFFGAMMVAQFFIVFFFFPETKLMSLEDLQRKLKIA